MNIVAGKIKLVDLQNTLNEFVENSYDYKNFDLNNLSSSKSTSDYFIKELLKKPIIVYVSENSLSSSKKVNDLKRYLKECIGIERIKELLYFRTLSQIKAENIEVDCILIESKYKDIQKVDVLSDLVNLDFMIKRNKHEKILENGEKLTTFNISESGKIDYKSIDDKFFEYYKDDNGEKMFNKKGIYFCQNLLSLKLTENRINNSLKLKFYSTPDQIDIEKYDIKNNVFTIKCPICGNAHYVKMFGYKNIKEINVKDYINYDKDKNRFNFNCDHKSTKYHDEYNKFSVKNDFNYPEELTEDQYDKLFLYMYSSFEKDNETIKYFDKKEKKIKAYMSEAFKKDQ